mmetsp:Transcript_13412/g.29129  ORF Transcript_13412/g.29129 Transcript_13412/m.29129 type:complete len:126 (+) Transcript_13412:3376-3753(+)
MLPDLISKYQTHDPTATCHRNCAESTNDGHRADQSIPLSDSRNAPCKYQPLPMGTISSDMKLGVHSSACTLDRLEIYSRRRIQADERRHMPWPSARRSGDGPYGCVDKETSSDGGGNAQNRRQLR